VRRKFIALANFLDRASIIACQCLLAIILVSQIIVITLRALFSSGSLQLQDMGSFCFAMLVVLAIPVATRRAAHVQVDVLSPWLGAKTRSRLELAATGLLLIPVFTLVFVLAAPNVLHAWEIFEASPQIGGLPGYFLVKTMLPIACVLTILQGIAQWIDDSKVHLFGRSDGY